jgi:predicted amidohydrolase
MKIRVAAAQMTIYNNNIDRNLAKAKQMVETAAQREAQIIGFPELFLPGVGHTDVTTVADPIPGRFTRFFADLAQEYGMYIVMGSIYEKTDTGIYNSTALLSDSGDLIGVYRKNKPFLSELKQINAGINRPVFKTKLGTIGMMICWDLAFPEVAREMAKKGATLLYIPVNWSTNDFTPYPYTRSVLKKASNFFIERKFVNTLVAARALENGITIVLVNGHGRHTTSSDTYTFIGQSQVVSPFYGAIAQENREQVLVVDTDLELGPIVQEKLRLIKDAD